MANVWRRGRLNVEDQLFRRAIPHSAELERLLADAVAGLPARTPRVVELGCGTGFSTAAILRRRPGIDLVGVDSDARSLAQAKLNLHRWSGSVRLVRADLLDHLSRLPAASVDAVVAKFTLHNLERGHRAKVLRQVHRVLKTGGVFANADKYAQEGRVHAEAVRAQMAAYLDLFLPLRRLDLLKEALDHTLHDEAESRVMRERDAVRDMRRLGFRRIVRVFRHGMDAVYTAEKSA